MMAPLDVTGSVLRVGAGRGFLAKLRGQTYVITAAHCLPELPPAHPGMYLDERTYPALLGTLGTEPSVWAECLFVDPVADVAVLAAPDNQERSDQHDAYERLLNDRRALHVGCLIGPDVVRLLALDGPVA